jgi:hypothetical protein
MGVYCIPFGEGMLSQGAKFPRGHDGLREKANNLYRRPALSAHCSLSSLSPTLDASVAPSTTPTNNLIKDFFPRSLKMDFSSWRILPFLSFTLPQELERTSRLPLD